MYSDEHFGMNNENEVYIEDADDAAYNERRRERHERHMHEREARERKSARRRKFVRLAGMLCASLAVCVLVIVLAVSDARRSGASSEIADAAERGVGDEQGQYDASDAEAVAVDALFAENGESIGELSVDAGDATSENVPEAEREIGTVVSSELLSAETTDDTVGFWDNIVSTHGVLIDVDDGEILAARDAFERINPASMTKILTVLVAAENVTDLDDTFTMTIDITDYSYVNDCSNVGYEVGEVMTVRDLFYGTVLPSGGDAAVALATYVAGSHEAFVDMMNERLVTLGISSTTHFTNCVGIYNEDHYSTAYDMAVILKAAIDNPWCRQVLSTHVYTTVPSEEHPDGIILSNWFLRRIEDKDTHGEVVCAKTGYVTQSGNCAASFATDSYGKRYICVTAGASSVWRCIYDQTDLYSHFLIE